VSLPCQLCEAGHSLHQHQVGGQARCAECRREGVVVATDSTDYDATLAKTGVALEVSAYGDGEVTCQFCESTRFQKALPVRGGICGACGKFSPKKTDAGFASSFCNDGCRSDYANGKRAS
jgi:hypothetical protein